MPTLSVSEVLEPEHHGIDDGLAAFAAGLTTGQVRPTDFRTAATALRRHIHLEEEHLFPPLRAGMLAPVLVMLREHGVIWDLLDEVERSLAESPLSSDHLLALCRSLETALERHNAKEEHILYPAADEALDAQELDSLRWAMDHGTLPPGWRCAMAGRGAPPDGARR